MANEAMDFATALGKLCDRYNVSLGIGVGELNESIVVLDKKDDMPSKYEIKRYAYGGGFFALEKTDGED